MILAISGAGGFIGQSLTTHLLKKTDISLRLNYFVKEEIPQSLLENKRCTFIIGDIGEEKTQSDLLDEADAFIHLAQNVAPMMNLCWSRTASAELVPTLSLLEKLKTRRKPLHILFSSSGGTVYKESDRSLSEADIICPVSPYGIQKMSIEYYLALLSKINPSITVNVLRISNPYGMILNSDRKQGFIGIALSRIIEKKPIQIWGSLDAVRDYIYKDDLDEAVIKALAYKNGYDVFNIGSGVGTSLAELLNIFKEYLGRTVEYEQFPLKEENYLPLKNVLNVDKASSLLQWKPETSVQAGVYKMFELSGLAG